MTLYQPLNFCLAHKKCEPLTLMGNFDQYKTDPEKYTLRMDYLIYLSAYYYFSYSLIDRIHPFQNG